MHGSLPRLVLPCLVGASWALMMGASPAAAQDPLTEAREQLDRARFAEAVEAFDRAARSDGLARDEVLSLLEGRVLARWAQRDVEGARADLRLLLALEPTHALGRAAPPALRRLFEEIRGAGVERLGLDVGAIALADGVEIRAEPRGPPELVRRVRVVEHREGRSVVHEGHRVRLRGTGPFRFHVELVGLGGAVLASAGSAERPMEGSALSRTDALLEEGDPGAADDGDGELVGWLLGGTGVVLAIGGVLAVVLALTLPSGLTQPTIPMEGPAP